MVVSAQCALEWLSVPNAHSTHLQNHDMLEMYTVISVRFHRSKEVYKGFYPLEYGQAVHPLSVF